MKLFLVQSNVTQKFQTSLLSIDIDKSMNGIRVIRALGDHFFFEIMQHSLIFYFIKRLLHHQIITNSDIGLNSLAHDVMSILMRKIFEVV